MITTWCDGNGEQGQNCPCWSGRAGGMCEVRQDGIFIPLAGHVEGYCQDANRYLECEQYQRGFVVRREPRPAAAAGQDRDSRRRYPRVEERLPIALALCDQNGMATTVVDNEAMTLDLSFGGLRLEACHFMMASSVVAFTFGEQFTRPGWSGLGAVQWSRPGERAGSFQSGVAIIDHRSSQVLGQHLGVVSS